MLRTMSVLSPFLKWMISVVTDATLFSISVCPKNQNPVVWHLLIPDFFSMYVYLLFQSKERISLKNIWELESWLSHAQNNGGHKSDNYYLLIEVWILHKLFMPWKSKQKENNTCFIK